MTATEPRTKRNPYEELGRDRKVRNLIEFLESLKRPDLLDPEVVALATEHEREQVGVLAKLKRKPSAETWSALVQALKDRKRRAA